MFLRHLYIVFGKIVFVWVLIGVFVFLLLISKNYLYILDARLLAEI